MLGRIMMSTTHLTVTGRGNGLAVVTHSNNGEINTNSNYFVKTAATNSSSDPFGGIAYETEIGSNKQYDASGNLTWETSFEWNYAVETDSVSGTTYRGEFLGGKEIRDGSTFVYDKDWNITSQNVQLNSSTPTLGDSSAGLASLIDGTPNTTDMNFSTFTASGIIEKITSAFPLSYKPRQMEMGIRYLIVRLTTIAEYLKRPQLHLLLNSRCG